MIGNDHRKVRDNDHGERGCVRLLEELAVGLEQACDYLDRLYERMLEQLQQRLRSGT